MCGSESCDLIRPGEHCHATHPQQSIIPRRVLTDYKIQSAGHMCCERACVC